MKLYRQAAPAPFFAPAVCISRATWTHRAFCPVIPTLSPVSVDNQHLVSRSADRRSTCSVCPLAIAPAHSVAQRFPDQKSPILTKNFSPHYSRLEFTIYTEFCLSNRKFLINNTGWMNSYLDINESRTLLTADWRTSSTAPIR